MKNKAIEKMVRIQHNIEPDTEVKVNCIMSIGDQYSFEVIWFVEDVEHVVAVEITSFLNKYNHGG